MNIYNQIKINRDNKSSYKIRRKPCNCKTKILQVITQMCKHIKPTQ